MNYFNIVCCKETINSCFEKFPLFFFVSHVFRATITIYTWKDNFRNNLDWIKLLFQLYVLIEGESLKIFIGAHTLGIWLHTFNFGDCFFFSFLCFDVKFGFHFLFSYILFSLLSLFQNCFSNRFTSFQLTLWFSCISWYFFPSLIMIFVAIIFDVHVILAFHTSYFVVQD